MNRNALLLLGSVIALCSAIGFAAETPSAASVVQLSDADSNTPLHLAVLRGDAEAVDTLLKAGADATAVNAAGATPLHYATAYERMVTALLAHGAPVNAVSKMLVTPLQAAVVHPDSFAIARRLIEAGADVNYSVRDQISLILNSAIVGGDRRTVELLLDRGVEVNPAKGGLPLVAAAFNGDIEIAKLLLERGASVNCRDVAVDVQPLSAALFTNHYDIVRLLIEHGADVKVRVSLLNAGPTNLILSAYNDARDPTVTRLLVERGADINSADENGETALSYALKRGTDGPLVAYLREAGAKDSAVPRRAKTKPSRAVPTDPAAREAMIRDSVQRAIAVIQPSSTAFLQVPLVRNQQKCTSCHQQDLPNVALALARERGLQLDQHELGRALHASVTFLANGAEKARQLGPGLPLNPLVLGYMFDDLYAYRFPPGAVTETMSRALLEFQHPDGSWRAPVRRPPMEDGPLVATAWAARALQLYPPAGHEGEARVALNRARSWLAAQTLRTLNDRIFQLLGIAWTNETIEHMRPLAEQLIAAQNADGGWSQFPTLEGDAWATGSALFALHKAGILTSHPAYERGVEFLLRTQFDDGSWWVRSRTIPTQRHFNGKFPHGKDQWISAAGTSWAMIALLLTLDPTVKPATLMSAKELIAAFEASTAEKTAKEVVATSDASSTTTSDAGALEFTRDIKPILERSCVGCHGGKRPKGSFDLTTRESLLKGGQSGEPPVIPGYAHDSPLIQYISGKVEDLEMPPLKRREKYPALSPEEIERLHSWIDAGAIWPATPPLEATAPAPVASSEGL